jgi:molybdopterin/thiamine biosynthesis adenylyltransferase
LSGIDFPKSKDSLKQYAKDHISKAEVEDADAVLDVLDDLPAREYTNMADVEKSISRVL